MPPTLKHGVPALHLNAFKRPEPDKTRPVPRVEPCAIISIPAENGPQYPLHHDRYGAHRRTSFDAGGIAGA